MEDARKALEEGRLADAVKLCKQLLKQDRSNYEGFVVLGMSLLRGGQQLDQAEMSFRKAISLDSSALPAYKGLVELRELTGNREQLVEAYDTAANAAKAAGESILAMEFTWKLANIHSEAQNYELAKAAWQRVLEMELKDEQYLEALCALVDAEAAIMEAKIQEYVKQASAKAAKHGVASDDIVRMSEVLWSRTEDSVALESHLRKVIEKLPYDERRNSLLLRILVYRIRSSTGQELALAKRQLVIHSITMLTSSASEMVAEVLLALAEEDDADEIFQVCEHFKAREADYHVWLGRHVSHVYPGRGITLAGPNMSPSRMELAEWELSRDQHSIAGWRTLAKVQALKGMFDKAFDSATKGLSAIEHGRKSYGLTLKAAELQLRLTLASFYLSKNDHNGATRSFMSVVEEANNIPEQRRITIIREAFQGMAKVSLALKEPELAQSRLEHLLSLDPEDHWALSERGWLAFQSHSLDQARVDLEKAVAACRKSAIYHYRLGRVYWESSGLKERALDEFLESAKLDPSQPTVFLYLGHYYREFAKDMRRAARCYQKAVALDPENEKAGEVLCDILDNGGQHMLEKNICEEASKKSPRAFWAWRRLGFIQAAEKEWSEAVVCAQHAVRGYPADARIWEALALSYKKLGMFSAGLKAFRRALDLDKYNVFAALEIGAIYMALSSFSNAVSAYRQALQLLPGNLTAEYGLACSLLGQARECLRQGAFSWGSDLLKEAMDLAYKNTMMYGHLVSIWKQSGDASLMYAQALPFIFHRKVLVTEELHRGTWQAAVNSWHDERLSAAKNAVRAYKRAIHLLPNEGSLYHDLALAMEYVSTLQKPNRPSQWSEAEIVVCGGLRLDGANSDMWVALGLVTQHRGLQQHAFIQALRLNANHALAWAYLGQLYLSLHDQVLAQRSFDRARSADPALALPWVGMSLLHSANGRKDQLLEAFASCSYAAQLSSMVDVHIGVGQLAAQTQNLDLPQVHMALLQAAHRKPLQSAAHNFKGLCCELRKDLPEAILAYKIARATCESTEQAKLITSNLARALCKAGYAKAAVLDYEKLSASGALDQIDDLRGYAIALHGSGQVREALVIVEKALRLAADAQYADLLILQSKLTYFVQGAQAALSLLLGASDVHFREGKICLVSLSLGISTQKPDLLSAALTRCRIVFSTSYAEDAYLLLASERQTGVTRNLIRALHTHPQCTDLRAKLAHIFLAQSDGLKSALVERLCNIDSMTSTSREPSFMVLTDATLANNACLRGAGVLGQLQRLVHKEPSNVEARCCLILFLLQDARRRGFPRYLCQAISRMSSITLLQLSASYHHKYLRAQLELCISECELQGGNHSLALDHAKAAAEFANAVPSLTLAATLQLARCYSAAGDPSSARRSIAGCHTHGSSLWQLSVIDLNLHLEPKDEAAISTLRQTFQQHEKNNIRLALLELVLARLYFEQGQLQLAEDAAGRAVSFWPNNPVLHLFHGAICMELVKSTGASPLLSKAISSLAKSAQAKSYADVPVACALLAQAESSRETGSRASSLKKWASNLRKEFLTWPATDWPRPAELYFQMALVAKQQQLAHEEGESCMNCPEIERSWKSWLQIALHLNPSCSRYWALLKNTT